MIKQKIVLALGIFGLASFSPAYSSNTGPIFGPAGSYQNSCHTFYQSPSNTLYALCENDESATSLSLTNCDLTSIWNDHGTLKCNSSSGRHFTITGYSTSASFTGSRACSWNFSNSGETLNISCEGKPWKSIQTDYVIFNCNDLSNDHGIVKCDNSPI